MSILNNFGLTGVSDLLRFGKSNGHIVFDGTNGFRVRNNANNAEATILIADGADLSSATTKGFVESYYTGTNATNVTSGLITITLGTNPGLFAGAGGLKLDYTALGTTLVPAAADIVTLSQGGIVKSTTIQALVDAATSIPPSAAVATITADGTNSSFNVGYALPNFPGLTTYVTKVKMDVTTGFSGGSVSNGIISDGIHSLMIAPEANIGTSGAYMAELTYGFTSNGDQCVINFTEIDGITPAIPTGGVAIIAVEYVMVGSAGNGGGNGVISVATGTGLVGGPITGTGTISMGTSGVTAGTYTLADITVDALGRITAASNGVAGAAFSWNSVAGTTQTAVSNSGYISNNAALTNITLPTTASIGDTIAVAGFGAGGWKLKQRSGQTVHFDSVDTTTGTAGYLQSNVRYDYIELLCVVTNTDFIVRASVGNITVI